MLDFLLARHLLLQASRIAFAVLLLLILAALGAALLRLFRVAVENRAERLLLNVATGFAAYQSIVRWLAELPLAGPVAILSLVLVAALAAFREWRTLGDDMKAIRWPRSWQSFVILLLVLPPVVMALAPAVSRDALIYHLRFPEMTLRAGNWAYDLGNTPSFYPAAMGTLYLPSLALDGDGVIAQLLHFGFFLLTIAAVTAIARRLGAATGGHAGVLVAAIPAAGIVAGWAWADAPLLFAFATSAVALVAGIPALAIVLLALAASIKYTALLAGAPLFAAALVVMIRGREVRRLFSGLALGLLVMSPWYVTNLMRTGNPVYPVGDTVQPAGRITATWSAQSASLGEVWSGYFLRPQSLDEDIGGVLFLIIAAPTLTLAFARGGQLRAAALIAVSIWLPFLPLTTAMRLMLPAAVATLLVAGTVFEQHERRRLAAGLVLVFALRGGIIVAAHNAKFFNPLPAAIGLEDGNDYVRRTFGPATLYERADRTLPATARVLAINEVRLFRFPRPVTAFDAAVLRRHMAGARDTATVVRHLRAEGITHLLAATQPVAGAVGAPLTPEEARTTRALIRASRMVDREGDLALFELP